jgi:hypothetical protein
MNALLQKTFFSKPGGSLWKWRFVKLGVVIVCLTVAVWSDVLRSHASLCGRFSHLLLFSTILFMCLTADFRWRRSTFVALRISTFISMLLLFASLLYSVLHHSR